MSYGYRRDNRTDEQFQKDISIRTKKEGILTNKWFKNYILKKYPDAKLIDNGVDNSGKIIKESNFKFSNSDYKLQLNSDSNPIDVEVKVSPVQHKTTFKEHDVLSYIKKKTTSFRMLVFLNAGQGEQVSKDTEWFVVEHKNLSKIIEQGKYVPCHRGFGGKPTYELNRTQLESMFKINKLNE